MLALGNLDPCIHFAILSDFADAESQDLPEDAAILAAARAGIEDLNRRFGPEHADRFFLFHRARRWNAREHAWMGWERKRGKLEEFNRLLRGATDTSFTVQVGELAVFPSVRYCITLDSDTRLPRDAAKAADRHHRASVEPSALRRARRPRHRGLRDSAAARQRHDGERGGIAVRPHLRRPHRRGPVHDRRLRRLPGSLQRRHFHRQGPLRRRRVRRVARGPRAGERAAVARSLRGPLCADGPRHRRRGRRRLSVERPRARETPAPLGARRLADPVVALSVRAVADGSAAQSPAAHVALEDPRQPAAQPDGAGDGGAAPPRLDRPAGLVRSPGRRSVSPRSRCRCVCGCSSCSAGRHGWNRDAAFLRTTIDDLNTDVVRVVLAAGVPRESGLRDAARDHRDARAPRDHEAPAARVGDGRGQRRSRRAAAPERVREGHDREPADRGRQPGRWSSWSVRTRCPRRCRCSRCGRRRR